MARVCDFGTATQPGLESDISVAKVTRSIAHSPCRLSSKFCAFGQCLASGLSKCIYAAVYFHSDLIARWP